MGKRGPKTVNPKIVLLSPMEKRYPNPQPGMSENARTVWKRIVRAYPCDYFKPQHSDLLRSYCESSALHKKAVHELSKSTEVITQDNGVMKENPWVGVMAKMDGCMRSGAVKLGITKNATIASREGEYDQSKPKSKREGLLFNG